MNLLMIFAAVITGRITQWQHYTHFGGVNDVIVENSTVISASTGGVAFGTLEGGGVSWDSTWTCPGELSISDARCLARDGSGNLWVGTYGGGIDVELASGGFQHYGQLEGLPISMKVNCILPDSIIWAGTTEGLCSKELGYFEVWTVFSTGGGLPSDIVNCVAACDSGLFVGTTSGLVMLRSTGSPGDPSSWVSYPSLESISIQDIIVGPDTSWAATGEGLFYMAPGGTWQRTADYPGDQPVSLALDQGRLAVGGNGEAAVRTASGWDYDQGLGTQVVRSICWLDDQSLLMGQYDDFSVDRSSGSGVGIGYPGGWISSMPREPPPTISAAWMLI